MEFPANMMTPVQIPKATLSMEGGTLVRWLKNEADMVQQDEVLFEMETDKVLVEVPSPASGILRKIQVFEGEVRVGDTVAWIGEAADALPETETTVVAQRPSFEKIADAERIPQNNDSLTLRVSPAARRYAKELGVDITRIRGTGPAGRILQEDVRDYALGGINPGINKKV